jgi:hypothetical protein
MHVHVVSSTGAVLFDPRHSLALGSQASVLFGLWPVLCSLTISATLRVGTSLQPHLPPHCQHLRQTRLEKSPLVLLLSTELPSF